MQTPQKVKRVNRTCTAFVRRQAVGDDEVRGDDRSSLMRGPRAAVESDLPQAISRSSPGSLGHRPVVRGYRQTGSTVYKRSLTINAGPHDAEEEGNGKESGKTNEDSVARSRDRSAERDGKPRNKPSGTQSAGL